MPPGTILVTGGARGIGRAIVSTLVASGEQVAFTYRSSGEEAAALERELDGRGRAYPLDLTAARGMDELVPRVEEELGPLDGLVNNAATRIDRLLALTSSSDWDEVIETNLGGVFRSCRAVIRGMTHRRRGAIVNVSSLSAMHGVAGLAAYGASKAGIIGLTRALAREVGKRGVRVNAVVPGFVATDSNRSLSTDRVAALRSAECLPGGVEAGCVAEAVCFLLSERARSITGQCLVVDAGVTA
jgi:3-oxoacyl-[acyl-carrier protein] reductase